MVFNFAPWRSLSRKFSSVRFVLKVLNVLKVPRSQKWLVWKVGQTKNRDRFDTKTAGDFFRRFEFSSLRPGGDRRCNSSEPYKSCCAIVSKVFLSILVLRILVPYVMYVVSEVYEVHASYTSSVIQSFKWMEIVSKTTCLHAISSMVFNDASARLLSWPAVSHKHLTESVWSSNLRCLSLPC